MRGVKGCFRRIAAGVAEVREQAAKHGRESPAKAIVFTISRRSYKALPEMPDVLRQLGIPGIVLVPYYYFDRATGAEYERVMQEDLGCNALSWRGFRRETSGVDPDEFAAVFREFKARLGDRALIPWMELSEQDYREWFSNCRTSVGKTKCQSPWRLLDIQPNGDANFCIDFPDYVIGNVTDHSVRELWHGERAERFRRRIEHNLLPICNCCGVKYV